MFSKLGGGGKPEEEKTVTAGTSAKVVTPSDGKTIRKVTVNPTPTEEKSVTPTTSQQTVSPSKGKHLAKVIVEAIEDVTPEVTAQTPLIEEIIEGLVGKAQGATATADKILEGYSAYVGGVLVDGTAKSGISIGDLGYTKYAIDTITPTTANSGSSRWKDQVPHSLGEIPQAFIIFITSTPKDSYALKAFASFYLSGVGDSKRVYAVAQGGNYSNYYDSTSQPFTSSYVNISPFMSSGQGLDVGSTYAILTMA